MRDSARADGVDITLVGIPFAGQVYDELAAGSLGNQAHLSITQHDLERRRLIGR
jgi:acetyl esterase